jgi:hypothetical protein
MNLTPTHLLRMLTLSSTLGKMMKQQGHEKMVCNPIWQAGSPTQHGSHIYTQVGCGHDGYLLRPSPHLSLAVDLVMEEPTA